MYMIYRIAFVLMCSAVCQHTFAMDSTKVELQKQFLTGIYEKVKDRQLEEGELNLIRNESAGFASAICSYGEKGTPSVTDGNRVMMFDLTKLTEAKESQVLIQLVIKTPTQQYFQSVKHLSLFKDCANCPDESEPNVVAHHTLLDTERDTEWLELTVQCASCNWKELDQISFVLQLTDDNDVPIVFTQEMAVDMKTFLVLYTYNSSTFLYESISRALERRQVSESNSLLENRTTIQELLDNNVTCSKQDIFLTAEELQFRGTIISSPSLIQFSYCFGECSHNLEVPANVNETLYDSRTRMFIHRLNLLRTQLHPPPCCIPNGLTPLELIVAREDDIVELETIPNVDECKCQF